MPNMLENVMKAKDAPPEAWVRVLPPGRYEMLINQHQERLRQIDEQQAKLAKEKADLEKVKLPK